MINDLETKDESKIYLTIALSFISSKDYNKIRTMQSESDNIDILFCHNKWNQ